MNFSGKHKKHEQPIFKPANAQPTHAPSKFFDTVIKSEFEPKVVSLKPTDIITNNPVRSSNSMTDHVAVPSAGSSTHHVVHIIRPSLPATALTPLVPVVKKVKEVDQITSLPAKSTNRVQPMIISTNIKTQQSAPSKIAESQTMMAPNMVIKTESASDGKKIKILSDVSLNDAKAKLLEIDKLSSKNLKFTNVIKGTDKSSSKSTVPLKAEIDKMSNSKFTNVITGTNDSRPSSSSFTSRPVMSVCTSSKPLKSELKTISSRNLKLTNVIEGTDKSNSTNKPARSSLNTTLSTSCVNTEDESFSSNSKFTNDGREKSASKLTFHVSNSTNKPARSSLNTAASSVKIEDETFSSKNLKLTNVIEGMDKNKFTAQPVRSFCTSSISVKIEDEVLPPKILNFSNVTAGFTSTNQPARSSCITSKPFKACIDNLSSKNLNFTNVNASKSTVHFSHCTSKPAMPTYSPTVPLKAEIEEIRPNDLNLPNAKRSKDIPLQTVVKTSVFKVKPSTSTEVATKQFATADENIEIIMPSKQKYLSKRDRGSNITETTSINDATKSLQDVLWATSNPRTYARHNIKRLLSDKIIKKTRLQEENVQNVLCKVENEQTFEIIIPTAKSEESRCEPSTVQCDLRSEKTSSELESKPICNQPAPIVSAFMPADDSAQSTDANTHSAPEVSAFMTADDSIHSETVSENNFYGFSIEEANESALLWNQIKTILSRRRPKELAITTDLNAGHERAVRTVGYDNEHWVLNYETGVLEEQIDKDATMVLKQKDVPPTSQSNAVNESTPKKPNSAATQVEELQSPICDISPIPSKIPVIEDADDEISDIDLADRSKAKCTGSPSTRRAILKSHELHRKAFMPVTTDDESELSLCVRPPRPKLRKSRLKQTIEQLKIQENAHVSLLKRFTRTDLEDDNLNDKDMVHFVDGMMDRIEVLENQVKSCFDRQNDSKVNVETISLSEQCAPVHNDPVTEENEPVKPSESVTENNEFVKHSESSLNCVVTTCEPQLHQSILSNNADTADDGEGKRTITNHMKYLLVEFIELFIHST